jgi:Cellulase (glycosyl hydrolase family 5)
MRHNLHIATILCAAALPASAQTWTQVTGPNNKPFDVLILNPPGDADPLILFDDPSTGDVYFFDQFGSGPLFPPGDTGSSRSAPPSLPSITTNPTVPMPPAAPAVRPQTPALVVQQPRAAPAPAQAPQAAAPQPSAVVQPQPPAPAPAPQVMTFGPPARAIPMGTASVPNIPVTLPPAPQFAPEQQVVVSPLQCGLFGITDGQIFGPSGQPFVSQGISLLDSEMGEVSPEQIISQFPNINTVNLAVGADGDGYATAQPNSAIVNWVNDATSHGLVVILSDYVPGQPEARSGADLQASLNWYASLAKTFANNPYVMWTTENEVGGNLSQEEQGIYNAIRGAGNNSIIFMEAQDGNATSTSGLDPSIYASMTGVAWNIHAYPWEFNTGSGSQASYDSTLESYVAMFQNFAHSADGVMPVLVGEGGNATDGNNVDDAVVNGKFATTQAIIDTAGVAGGTTGYEMWLHDWHGTGGDADELVGSNGALTAYGQQVAAGMLPANQPPVCTESPSLANQPITSLGPALNMPGVPSSD